MRVARCCVLALAMALIICGCALAAKLKTENVVFVMADGLRWEEVFHGADATLMNKDNGVKDETACRKAYWREDQAARRQALMPFFWNVVAKKGQVFGNRDLNSSAIVLNPYWFSFPGYSEVLCGYVDPGVNSNNLINNPNVSVLEWLSRKPEYKGKVAAFMAWNALPYILNRDRAGFFINAGLEPVKGKLTPNGELLNRLKAETTGFWEVEAPDSITFYTAMDYLMEHKPRVFFLSLGWTDEAAHENKYDEYLKSARLHDYYVQTLWNEIQAMPQYKNKTTLILATDHGRGSEGANWRHHGASIPGANHVWMAFMGPDTPALGERKDAQEVSLSNIAATLAAFLGQDYCKAQPKAGKPTGDVVR